MAWFPRWRRQGADHPAGDDPAAGRPDRAAPDPPAPASAVQAPAGFAYQVSGADAHLFGDATPVYVLRRHTAPTPVDDAAWLRAAPSRMLNARFVIVPFTGRDGERDDLRTWCLDGPGRAVRWLHGPGGQGKTRLAGQVAADMAALGWLVVTASHTPGVVESPPGHQDLRTGGAAGLLVLVDYADRWPTTHLAWLFGNRLLDRADLPVRVLLVARTVDPWPAVRALAEQRDATTSAQFLTPLPDDGTVRAAMFTAARDSFARRYGLTDADRIGPPAGLDGADLGLTLALHMAALVAVDGYATGARVPDDPAGLTGYLLDREHLHWANRYGDGTHDLDPQRRGHRTPPEVMNQVVFVAALTGAVRRRTGRELVRRILPGVKPKRTLADHAACYPPAAPDTVLEPIYPDRLAEDFLALTLPGHDAAYPAQPWATGHATSVLRPDDAVSTVGHPDRALIMLAEAAGRWPHVGGRYLYPLLRDDPRLAVRAGGPALTGVVALTDVPVDVLTGIEALLPEEQHAEFDVAAAIVAERLAAHRMTVVADPAEQAELQLNLGYRLGNAGRWDDAHAATAEAVRRYRELVAAGRPQLRIDLAYALNNLTGALARQARHDAALATAEEAVTIVRDLAGQDPDTYRLDLAAVLGAQALTLRAVGRSDEALTAIREANRIHRSSGGATSTDRLADLARTTGNLAIIQREAGRMAKAAASARRAVRLYRRLARADPAGFVPQQAMATVNHAAVLLQMGRWPEALSAAEEAVGLYRRLAAQNPAGYDADLALAVHNVGAIRLELGQFDAASTATDEATDRYRRLDAAHPGRYRAELARTLANRTAVLLGQDRAEPAVTVGTEAVRLYRRLVADNPAPHTADFGSLLANLAAALAELDRASEAVAVSDEAVALYRRLVAADPARHRPRLANTLGVYARVRLDLDRHEEAYAAAQEAAGHYRALGPADNPAHALGLARSLLAAAQSANRLDRPESAAAAATEARELLRPLSTEQPAFRPDLVAAGMLLGAARSAMGQWSAARDAADEAYRLGLAPGDARARAILDELADVYDAVQRGTAGAGLRAESVEAARYALALRRILPDTSPAGLARAVAIAATRLFEADAAEEALELAREGVERYRPLADGDPGTHRAHLAFVSATLGRIRYRLGHFAEAAAAAAEAVAIYRDQVGHEPDTRLAQLARELYNLAIARHAAGEPAAGSAAVEAVEAFRRLAVADPAAWRPSVAQALAGLAAVRSAAGDTDAARVHLDEAVTLFRSVPTDNLAVRGEFAAVLHNRSILTTGSGDWAERSVFNAEAVALSRDLLDRDPSPARLMALARALELTWLLATGDRRPADAESAVAELVDVYRRLVATQPRLYRPVLARILGAHAGLLAQVGRPEEALPAAREAVELAREALTTAPPVLPPGTPGPPVLLANMLEALTVVWQALHRPEDALTASAEAVRRRRALHRQDPQRHEVPLVATLRIRFTSLTGARRWNEALTLGAEIVERYRSLAETDPVAYRPQLALLLWGTTRAHLDGGLDLDRAVDVAEECVDLYRELATADPAGYTAFLDIASTTRDELTTRLGHADDPAPTGDGPQ
ncbi:tetratricopeptide repeat protein [Micromonospora echinofusca]|uniref:Tetratricopeptide repeat protein n=1 Tax=Micromonospora echinofusca TaxID=47858 RepID=A0ABS3VJY1_MICEH|nr:tetratricopeptide repeat protein [Micromonospora echinofusca]MBO4204834.1 tetratricopeptide repeat protein [Micromonospora echinofusca]